MSKSEAAYRAAARPAARLAAMCLMAACLLSCGKPAPDPAPRNLVLIVVDTLRQDRNGCYGHPRPTSPALDALAAQGTLFRNAYTVSPWTLPSMASIFTGLYPGRHGVTAFREILPQEAPTLPEILERNGFASAGVVSNVLLKREYGFARGFQRFDESQAVGHRNVSTGPVTDFAGSYLRRLAEQGDRFFLFVHYFDPHYRYQRHPMFGWSSDGAGRLDGGEAIQKIRAMDPLPSPEEVDFLVDCYDEEIAWTDRGVRRLLRQLDALGLSDDTIVVFTSDHGEEFLSRGWLGHTNSLYDELMRVPLVVRDPRHAARVEQRPTSVVGVTPTVLELLGVSADAEFQGESFAGGVTGGESDWSDELLLEVDFHPDSEQNDDKRATLQGLRRDDWKIVRDTTTDDRLLFDLERDPLERQDRTGEEAERAEEMTRALAARAAWAARGALTPDSLEVDESQHERLRALGYVGN
ncbi:MAG TPA: sulfatase [bacterium]|nr:sulfatase [bacterium]